MVLTNIKNKVIQIQDKWLYVLVLLLFTFQCGNSLPYAEYVGMSLQEYVLYVISDHYYLVYAWFFFLLFWSTRQISQNFVLERIRYGSNHRYREIHCAAKSIQLFVMILAHILIATLIGITKLNIGKGFSAIEHLQTYDSNLDVLLGYANIFDNCTIAIVCVALYWWLGSQFLFRMMFYAHELWRKKGLYSILLLALVSGMVGFMTHYDESVLEVVFYNNYFILHHVLLGVGEIPTLINICIMLFLPSALNVLEKKRNMSLKGIGRYIQSYSYMNTTIMIVFVVTYLIIGIVPLWMSGVSALEVVFGLLKGFSYQSFNLTEFLYYIAFYVFPLFLINAFWEKERTNKNEIAMFRVGSHKIWNRIVNKEGLRCIFRYYICYISTLIVCSVGVCCFSETKTGTYMQELSDFYMVPEETIYWVIIISALLKGIELILLYEISLSLYRITKQPLISFLGIFSLYTIGFIEKFDVLIVGKSAVYQILENIQAGESLILGWEIVISIGVLIVLSIVNYTGGKCNANSN